MFIKKIYKILIFPYTLFLLYLMLFGFGREPMEAEVVRVSPIASTIHFVENRLFFKRYFSIFTNIFGNVILFMPFGFMGILFRKYYKFKNLIIDFIKILIVVEFVQYISRMGVFDIDDILLNSIGVYLGFRVFRKFVS